MQFSTVPVPASAGAADRADSAVTLPTQLFWRAPKVFGKLLHSSHIAADRSNQKHCETGYRPASQCCPDFTSVDGNASIKQVATVVVPIVERDAEQSWGRQRAVGSHHRERYRVPIIGPGPGEGHGLRNLVKGRGRDLRRLKVDA